MSVGGVGGNEPVPSINPEEDTSQTEQSSNTQSFQQDVLEESSSFQTLRATSQRVVQLEEGRISIIEWAGSIGVLLQRLKEELHESDFEDYELVKEYLGSVGQDINLVRDYLAGLGEVVDNWRARIDEAFVGLQPLFDDVDAKTKAFNDAVDDVVGEDDDQIKEVNDAIEILTDSNKLQAYANANHGGDIDAARDELNQVISDFNDYLDSRGASEGQLSQLLSELSDAVNAYNTKVASINAVIAEINEERHALGIFELLDLKELDLLPSLSGKTIDDFITYSLDPVDIPPGGLVPEPTKSDVISVDLPVQFQVPEIADTDIFSSVLTVQMIASLSVINVLIGQTVDLLLESIELEQEDYVIYSGNIIYPARIVENANRAFVESAGTIGGGVGTAAFSMGMQNRKIEVALSSGMLRSLSSIFRQPLSGREFSTLLSSTMELMSRSSLLSALPSVRMLANRLGTLGAKSPVIGIAVGAANAKRASEVVSEGVLNRLANEQLKAGEGTEFSQGVAAAENITILGVALANLGRKIGKPDLVAQVFGLAAGIPPSEILTKGSRISDVLENPINQTVLKQTLLDKLVSSRGFSSDALSLQINSAINSIALRGGVQTFSHLRTLLREAFQKEGISPLNASILTNEAVALIKGDLGVKFLNVKFALNFDSSEIASSIVGNFREQDGALADKVVEELKSRIISRGDTVIGPEKLFERTLEEAIDEVRNEGGFEVQREFRDRLRDELSAQGFGRNAASFLANSAAAFGIDGSVASVYGVSPEALSNIGQATVGQLSSELEISPEQAQSIFEEAKERTLDGAPFFTEDQFKVAFREEIQGSVQGSQIFDRAVASLTPDVTLEGLVMDVDSRLTEILKPELGARAAEELKNEILTIVFGGTTIDEIGNKEKRNPLSLYNQVQEQTSRLLDVEGKEAQDKVRSKLVEQVEAWTRPNAELGFTLRNSGDGPSTFIGSILVEKPKGEFLDIPV